MDDNTFSHPLEKNLRTLQDAMQIHNLNSPYNQYYEMSLPFSIQLATNRLDDPECSYRFVTLAPGLHSNISFERDFMEALGGLTSLHNVNCTKLMYVLEGNIYLNIEGKQILYTPGSCYLINRNIRHTEEFNTDYQVVFFNFSDDFINRLHNFEYSYLFSCENEYSNEFLEYILNKNFNEHTSKTYLDYYPVLYEDAQKAKMHDIFEQMFWVLLNPKFGSSFRLQSSFCELIEILSTPDYYQINRMESTSNIGAIIFSRISHLLHESNGRISRHELEMMLNYSGSYLNKIVKKYTGMSLFNYSMTFCLTAAEEMLRNSDDNVAIIMEKLHFTNQTHFYRLFKERHGLSPIEYRHHNVSTSSSNKPYMK